jgi:D-aspartate ligase
MLGFHFSGHRPGHSPHSAVARPGGSGITSAIPAVVVGGDANGLGIVHSLREGRVPTIVVDDDSRRPGMHSRHARAVAVRAASGTPLVEGLLTLRETLPENPVLFLTYDYHVEAVSRHWNRLSGAFRMRMPEHRRVCELLHKSDFQRLAEQHGFCVPRAVAIRGEPDLASLNRIRFPAVIKPGAKSLFFSGKAPRARRVGTREQAEDECREILADAPDLIVQEWIEGAESDIYFCLQYRGEGGATVASFTGRKLRCWPPQTGNTVSCIAAPEAARMLEPLTTGFFDAVGFEGMCSLEFKRDRKSGQFFLIEPTVGRADWQEEVATLHGVNIPLAAYCHELGLSMPASEAPPVPVIWRAPTCYWRSVLATRRSGVRAPTGAKVRRAVWRRDDPVPLAFYCLEWLRHVARRAGRREEPPLAAEALRSAAP